MPVADNDKVENFIVIAGEGAEVDRSDRYSRPVIKISFWLSFFSVSGHKMWLAKETTKDVINLNCQLLMEQDSRTRHRERERGRGLRMIRKWSETIWTTTTTKQKTLPQDIHFYCLYLGVACPPLPLPLSPLSRHWSVAEDRPLLRRRQMR